MILIDARLSARIARRWGDNVVMIMAERGTCHVFQGSAPNLLYNVDGHFPRTVTMFERITFDPLILGGRACIRGMRLPVSMIVGQIAHGASWDEVLADYPDLEREDIAQALAYAAWLTQEEVRTA
jgi:uncharacterized protein (DUF433 family)